MWSAIPVALLCMIVVKGSRAADPKGTEEDFCSSIRPPICHLLHSVRAGLRLELAGLRPEMADFKSARAN